jgi:predicted enzyme related to lactoylglutathione lyase
MQNQMRLTFIALNVSNLVKSLTFYGDVLGVPLDRASHDSDLNDAWYGGEHAAHSWTDGAFIHFALYPAREPHRPTTTSAQVGFHVHEFEATHDRIVRSGAPVVQEPRIEPWGKTARYLDPDGNIVSITAASAPKREAAHESSAA